VDLYDTIISQGLVNHVEWQLLTTPELDVLNLSTELRELAINEIDRCIAKYSDSSGIDVLSALRKTISDSLVNSSHKNEDLIRWTDNLEKNQMKKEKLFSDLWWNIHTKIKQNL
jgi:hypothetical protein